MKVKIAVPPWIARDLAAFEGTRVRLSQVKVDDQNARIELTVSDKAIAHWPGRPWKAER